MVLMMILMGMTMDLNKGEDQVLWETSDYIITPCPEMTTLYEIVNRNTGQVEMQVETEPESVIGMLYLQDRYDEIMKDPIREFKLRKAQREQTPGHSLVS